MERKTTKMLALVAVIGLCAVALIGAAYAAFAGSASTYNQGNSTAASYMTLTPQGAEAGSWTPIVGAVENEFSTYVYTNSGVKTAYYLPGMEAQPVAIDTASYTYKELGSKQFILSNKTGENITATALNIKASAGVGNTTFVYFLKVTDGTTTAYKLLDAASVQSTTAKTFEFAYASPVANNGTITYTVSICIGYIANGSIDDEYPIGAPGAVGSSDIDVVTPVAPNDSDVPAGFNSVDFAFNLTATTSA